MSRPIVEVADILRAQGDRFLDRYRRGFDFQQLKAFRAIQRCRTAALGGHIDACPKCGHQAISYNSCRNRHCPKCQTQAREHWLAARERELLATSYFHVVFTVSHELNVSALDNPRVFYDLFIPGQLTKTLLKVAGGLFLELDRSQATVWEQAGSHWLVNTQTGFLTLAPLTKLSTRR